MKPTLQPGKLLVTAIMLLFGVIFLLPFLWMISTSFKVEADVFIFPIQWIPTQWNIIQNYTEVWNGKYPFALYYFNSIKISVITTVLSVLISSMAAYGFSKVNFKGKEIIFIIVLATYMVPHQAFLVPQFVLYRWLGLFNSHLGLILLGSVSVLGTFMLRQFYMGIHNEFIESAKMDGANHIRIFFSIAFPLVRPAVATYAILRFIWTWNDFLNPTIFIKSDILYTIPIALKKFSDAYGGQTYSLIMAGAVSAIIPLLIIFVVAQKQVIEGIAVGGVKG
ncbi:MULTISPECIES: carbohydrate ABC transporter permease [unclassified Paenibacillus]|uniref:carbohydrate ABC transporter permease n=1 Tax=unclassified Paenibacillus TaxID=185978 RepID=UPI0027803A86|nr:MULTISPECIES: carbohydrate ABC transporter permease [unclassified Paenibacillus]MDQ0902087.1 multiple sugar transport system permease protein [Paenibacillus sp. V4I7]MDQ0919419.1 multiple sugar transport system permease protein [Paenibacillus sp. V4I5]